MFRVLDLLKTLDSTEQKDLSDELAKEPEPLPLRGPDIYARAMFKRASQVALAWVPKKAADVALPLAMDELEKVDVIPGLVAIAPADEGSEVTSAVNEIKLRVLRSIPLFEDERQWGSLDEAKRSIEEHLESLQPAPFVDWPDVTSDTTLSFVAFQGIAAHLLESAGGKFGDAAYLVDLAWMSGLPVRPGNERLGACAYFAADRTLLRIYTGYDDTMHEPGDESWEHAKWHWRCAVFAYATIANHLGELHFVCSELMMQAAREKLPTDHALRRFLTPHIYGVGAVNARAGLVLAAEGGLAHRLWPFTYQGMATLLARGVTTASFEPFPETMAAKGFEELGDSYPYATDGLELHAICKNYAQEYLDLYFPNESIVADPDVRRWWRHLLDVAPQTGLAPLVRQQQVVELLGQFIFMVSGYHAQVGADTQYLLNPSFMGGRVRSDSEIADIQTTILMLTLNGLTGLYQPKLLDDYTHLFLEEYREEASRIFENFQAALHQLGRDIDARNEKRDLPFRTFHPALLDVAVAK